MPIINAFNRTSSTRLRVSTLVTRIRLSSDSAAVVLHLLAHPRTHLSDALPKECIGLAVDGREREAVIVS
jgi:hypothetical protein